jgi:hypothetical protein
MRRPIAATILAAGLALAAAGPAQADTTKDTPGGPCTDGPGQGTGNPCNGNHGNPSPEGNAREKIDYDHHPDPFTIARPGNDRGAFITQIGNAGRATISQSVNTQYARIDQRNGDSNRAQVSQSGNGAHYALVAQDGSGNQLDLTQSGLGAEVALLQQTGSGNIMLFDQQGGSVSSGVAATQLGDSNTITLAQSGDNNQARLVQDGSGNAMTASQTGGNNQLSWTQVGDNHSDLAISQSGGDAVAVTQSW